VLISFNYIVKRLIELTEFFLIFLTHTYYYSDFENILILRFYDRAFA